MRRDAQRDFQRDDDPPGLGDLAGSHLRGDLQRFNFQGMENQTGRAVGTDVMAQLMGIGRVVPPIYDSRSGTSEGQLIGLVHGEEGMQDGEGGVSLRPEHGAGRDLKEWLRSNNLPVPYVPLSSPMRCG